MAREWQNESRYENHDDDDDHDDHDDHDDNDANHDDRWRRERDKVKAMTRRAWRGYVAYAWGDNELAPLSRRGVTSGISGARLGLTIIDSLSTLHVMGLEKEFKRARNWVAKVIIVNS